MTGLPKTSTLFRYRMQGVWGKELLVLQIGRPTYSCPELGIQGVGLLGRCHNRRPYRAPRSK